MKTTTQNLDRPAKNQRYIVRWTWTVDGTTFAGQSASGLKLKDAQTVAKDLWTVSGIEDSVIEPVD